MDDPGPDEAGDRPTDAGSVPAGAVRGRAWHRISIAAFVGLLVTGGVLLGTLGLVDAIAGTGGNPGPAAYLAGSALALGMAGFVVTLLVLHGLSGGRG